MYRTRTGKNRSKTEETCERKTGTKLHDSKPVAGKGCLTQSEIDKLQNYCGLAIRRNVNNLRGHEESCVGCLFAQVVNK
jgi:hypothetical protein